MVTFKSQSHGDILMFEGVAKSLLKMMGQSGNVPGAIMAADVAAAHAALQDKLAAEQVRDQPAAEKADASADEDEVPVGLSTRAIPLLEMLQAAIDSNDNVMWE